jgi:TfoX/Sxy family transcriptional regulator of competence genes
MAYNETLANKIREILASKTSDIEEKKMMGGLTFMINGKMCVGVINDDLMARIDHNVYEDALTKKGCREMDFTGKPMKGYVFIGPDGTSTVKELNYWIQLALDFNHKAKSSKKKKK